MKFNDVILQAVTKVVVFIILTYSFYLFFAGHHQPGGGFIGGLATACAMILLYLAFDIRSVQRTFPIDFRRVGAAGVLIAVLTGAGSFLFDVPFLTQAFGTISLPVFGETDWATAVLFDFGVYLAVIGTTLTMVLSIAGDV